MNPPQLEPFLLTMPQPLWKTALEVGPRQIVDSMNANPEQGGILMIELCFALIDHHFASEGRRSAVNALNGVIRFITDLLKDGGRGNSAMFLSMCAYSRQTLPADYEPPAFITTPESESDMLMLQALAATHPKVGVALNAFLDALPRWNIRQCRLQGLLGLSKLLALGVPKEFTSLIPDGTKN